VGGGGLIAGIATYIKHYAPNIQVIGVEPKDSPTLYQALKNAERVILPEVGRFADGVAVKQIGEAPTGIKILSIFGFCSNSSLAIVA
jgi:threonine dehydratase